jgi:hypothetical protein
MTWQMANHMQQQSEIHTFQHHSSQLRFVDADELPSSQGA